jgi:hypothetical protein
MKYSPITRKVTAKKRKRNIENKLSLFGKIVLINDEGKLRITLLEK